MKVKHNGKEYTLFANWTPKMFEILKFENPKGKVSLKEPPYKLPIGELELVEED